MKKIEYMYKKEVKLGNNLVDSPQFSVNMINGTRTCKDCQFCFLYLQYANTCWFCMLLHPKSKMLKQSYIYKTTHQKLKCWIIQKSLKHLFHIWVWCYYHLLPLIQLGYKPIITLTWAIFYLFIFFFRKNLVIFYWLSL